jgi:hypothetical protein
MGGTTEEVDMDEPGRGSAAAVEFPSDASLTKSFVGFLKARDVHLTESVAGFVAAGGNLSIRNGGCGPVLANGSVTIRNGGCGPLVANGDVSIENGGTQLVVASGGARIGQRAFVGVVVSPSVTVEEGGRVLASAPLAFAVGAGAGVAVAMLWRLVRRK